MNFRLPGFAKGQRHRPMTLLVAVLFSGVSALSFAAPKSKTHTVEIEALKFSPAILEVMTGDTVIWKNKDAFPHNVTAERKPLFSAVTLCGNASLFFQMTVSPFITSRIAGENFNASISTVCVLDFGAANDKALTPDNRTARSNVIGR